MAYDIGSFFKPPPSELKVYFLKVKIFPEIYQILGDASNRIICVCFCICAKVRQSSLPLSNMIHSVMEAGEDFSEHVT